MPSPGSPPLVPWFSQRLRPLKAVLCSLDARERFIAKCLEGTSLSCFEWMFRKKFSNPDDDRWGAITTFLKQVYGDDGKTMSVLRQAWSSKAFFDETSAGPGSRCKQMTNFESEVHNLDHIISDGYFWGLLLVILELNEIPDSLLAWAGGCPCHEHILLQADNSLYGLLCSDTCG